MSEKEKENLFEKLRNQVIGVVVTGALGWLLMSFMFMATINGTVSRIEAKQEKQDARIDRLQEQVLTLKSK